MKVLHVIDSGGLYGAETVLLHLMTEQRRMGVHPVLASIGIPSDGEKPLEVKAQQCGLEVIPFRMRPGPNWAGAMTILRYAWQEEIDVLHSHGYKGNILFGLLPQLLRRLPLVSTLHGWTSVGGGFSRMGLYEWLESVSLRFVDRVVLVNEGMREYSRLTKLPRKKLAVVENGIPFPVDTFAKVLDPKILDFTRNRFTFGAIGRLSQEKGFDILLEALAGLLRNSSDVQLVILGEGGERPLLEEKVKKHLLEERVLLPGFVAEAKDYLPFFDAFVMSSLTEGLPMVLLEAMAAGIPIVATRVGGIPKALGDGKGGWLVDAGDAVSLKKAMISIVRESESTKKSVEWAGRHVRERYSSRAMAEAYQRIYDTLLL
jgi:glycosyltransferase involved in cell wall biosynthesis